MNDPQNRSRFWKTVWKQDWPYRRLQVIKGKDGFHFQYTEDREQEEIQYMFLPLSVAPKLGLMLLFTEDNEELNEQEVERIKRKS